MKKAATIYCPCGRGVRYEECCARWHRGEPAPDAESLMRARYTAYAMNVGTYILDTWHPSTRPSDPYPGPQPHPRWIELRVLSASETGDEGTVEFVARFRVAGRAHKLQETSRFRREQGRWYYLDGDIR